MQVKDYFRLIQEIEDKIRDLRSQRTDLRRQLRDAQQVEFEEKHGIKQGDILKAIDGRDYYYDSIVVSPFDTMYVLCRLVMNDGTPGKVLRHFCEEDFF